MSELPNLWVSRDVYGGPIASEQSRFTDEVLYIPAARIRELVEQWRAFESPRPPSSWWNGLRDGKRKCADELEALLGEEG